MTTLREQLVATALDWESRYGNAPAITSVLSEYDAAMLIGMSEKEYSAAMRGVTAVQRGFDFIHSEKRYQVKGSRPSGKAGSKVTLVSKAKNYEWDSLIWILYDCKYVIMEAWSWEVEKYKSAHHDLDRIRPIHIRNGVSLSFLQKSRARRGLPEDAQ
jgi:hypothetical protein